jgi:hypothetical protein
MIDRRRRVPILPLALAASLLAALAGCALDAMEDTVPPPRSPVLDRLSGPFAFSVDGAASLVAVEARALASGSSEPVEFAVQRGRSALRVTPDGFLILDDIDVELSDVLVPAELIPPAGLPIKDVRVRIERPSAAPLEEIGGVLLAVVEVDLLVDWSGEFGDEGNVYPLRSVRLGGLRLEVELGIDAAGAVVAHFSAARAGAFWDWARRFELSDLVVELAARAD